MLRPSLGSRGPGGKKDLRDLPTDNLTQKDIATQVSQGAPGRAGQVNLPEGLQSTGLYSRAQHVKESPWPYENPDSWAPPLAILSPLGLGWGLRIGMSVQPPGGAMLPVRLMGARLEEAGRRPSVVLAEEVGSPPGPPPGVQEAAVPTYEQTCSSGQRDLGCGQLSPHGQGCA